MEKLSFSLSLQWQRSQHTPPHCLITVRHLSAHKKRPFFYGRKMNVTLAEQIAVGEPRTRRYSSGHTQLTLSALGGVAGPRWR